MVSVTYSSTRGCETQKNMSFRDVVMTGLAHDRGLFIPDSFPTVSKEELESWRSLSYSDLAVEVISKFVEEDQVPKKKLADIVKRSCGAFRHNDVTPVKEYDGHYILVSVHVIMAICDSFSCRYILMLSSSNRNFSMDLLLLSKT